MVFERFKGRIWSLRVVFAPPFDGFNSQYRSQYAFTAFSVVQTAML